MITMRPTDDSKTRYQQAFDDINRALDVDAFEMFKVGHEVWADRVHEIFEMEGDPRWIRLRPTTMYERVRHGYPPDHPILRRTGTLEDSLTDINAGIQKRPLPNATPDVPILVGNFSESKFTSGGVMWRFATVDERFWPLHYAAGEPWSPRPMVPVGGQRDEVGREIEKRLIKMVRNG